MMTDPIADMLTRIRNAQLAKKQYVEIPISKVKQAIAQVLLAESYLAAVEGKAGKLVVELKYEDKRPAITSLCRESKPGHRSYKKATELPNVLNGYGTAIVSTSQGIMTAKAAKDKGIGGEVLCSVY